MSSDTASSVPTASLNWREDVRFEAWKVVPVSVVVSEDFSSYAYFIISPRGDRCAVVLNDRPLAAFPVSELSAYRLSETPIDEDGREFDDSTDWSEELDEDEGDEDKVDDDGDDLTGVDPDNDTITLSPNGKRIFFSTGVEGSRMLFIDGKCHLAPASVQNAYFSDDSSRLCIIYYDLEDDNEPYFFTLEDACHSSNYRDGVYSPLRVTGFVTHSEFSPDSAYHICFLQKIGQSPRECTNDLLVNGERVITGLRLHNWRHPGEALCPITFVFDSNSRSILLGSVRPNPEGEEGIAQICIYYLETEKCVIHRYMRIVSARCSPDTNFYEVFAITKDGSIQNFTFPRNN